MFCKRRFLNRSIKEWRCDKIVINLLSKMLASGARQDLRALALRNLAAEDLANEVE